MKKIVLLAAVIISASFVSCKKNWNCECTNSIDSSTYNVRSTKMKKSEAKTWCESGNSTSLDECKLK